jgi:hypothetical protein
MSLFCHFRVFESNKAEWSGTWSVVLSYLTGRIASPFEPVVSTVSLRS